MKPLPQLKVGQVVFLGSRELAFVNIYYVIGFRPG